MSLGLGEVSLEETGHRHCKGKQMQSLSALSPPSPMSALFLVL